MTGHTPGSITFVVRTPRGRMLLNGDTSRTRSGCGNAAKPRLYTQDHESNARQLARLKQLAAEQPAMEVRLGHQEVKGAL